MRYRVTFRKRFNQQGEGSDDPQATLELDEGVVVDAAFVERFEPDSVHVEEDMEEDDDVLPFGSEVWEYDVAPGREKDFRNAVERSGVAMEVIEVSSALDDR
jgi:hypothetical protein